MTSLKLNRARAFTLVEMLMASSVFAGVTVALLSFSQTSLRLISRNLATNHSHEAARTSDLKLLRDVHEASSPFRLFTYDGTTYTDLDPVATTDKEPLSLQFVSTRANGVRFRKLAGGPYQLSANVSATDTNLTFNFSVGGQVLRKWVIR